MPLRHDWPSRLIIKNNFFTSITMYNIEICKIYEGICNITYIRTGISVQFGRDDVAALNLLLTSNFYTFFAREDRNIRKIL